MNSLSRRTIVRSAAFGAAVLAVSPKRALMAQPSERDRAFESEFTGSVIELIDDYWNFNTQFYEIVEVPDYSKERVMISGETATVEVEFVQTDLTPEEYLDAVQSVYIDNWDGFELADSGTTEDGAWFAGTAALNDISINMFAEYQAGAYEDADLVVIVNSNPGSFVENLDVAQEGILIGDLEPMLMIETSDVASLTFPVVAVAAATETTGRTSRSTRGTSTATETPESGTRSNRRGQSTQSTGDTDYVAAVRAHREQYVQSMSEFAESLGVIADDTSTQAQQTEAFDTIDAVASAWSDYPTTASEISAPAELADLEEIYLEWADEIGTMGDLWFAALSGMATIDDLINQLDVVDAIDIELKSALDAL